MAAYLNYLKKQSRLDHNDNLKLSCIFARDASKERISHCTCALHCFLQARLLPDRTCTDPPSAKHTLRFLKTKAKTNSVTLIFQLKVLTIKYLLLMLVITFTKMLFIIVIWWNIKKLILAVYNTFILALRNMLHFQPRIKYIVRYQRNKDA